MRQTTPAPLVVDYLDDCRGRKLSPRTVRWYEDKLERFIEWAQGEGIRDFEECTKRVSTRFLAGRTEAGAFTLNGYVETFKRLTNWAVKEGYLQRHA